jgi:uncharacterized protein YodC (DUF2158 family)
MPTTWKTGEKVRLKSGGPRMTIDWVDVERVHCQWFDSSHKLQAASFPADSLEPADE